ncbi:uncharacterized protein LOC111695285 [Eurytemora carolleeae]|uniref:uncharacterized protein LOC111695285 n=1 Tax=Eurytemora carolleeae TaxID=1294199 RepID=UPI000C75BEDA|nr:uncharacterized protein LOC111695285 [Eurytemora carolleeae]|eukprot:XP_023320310.1 uncharacterized protein LOC111695285 [Eurytemora affinis]
MFHGWISRFGVPAVITSDRGAQFTSSLWSAICSLLKIKHKTTTAFHPQSNGMVERFHRCTRSSNQLFYENLKKSMSGFQPTPPRHNTPAAENLPEVIPAELSSCPMVFIRKDGHVAPLAPLYEGPYKVLSRSLKTFQLQVGKRVEVVSVQRLKPAFTAEDEAPVEPPRRGRPPRQPPPVPPDPPRRRGHLEKLLQKPPPLLRQRGEE